MNTKNEVLKLALEAHQAMREWIDAVPDDTVLPTMPGCDRDWLDTVEAKLKQALAAQPAVQEPLMVDMRPPATQRDRWMYEQGRLAERDPRSHPTPPAAQPAVPEGWKLAPVELTDEMRKATDHAESVDEAWKSMLAAAPEKGQS